jgi:serine/threonine-protein kinase HipA
LAAFASLKLDSEWPTFRQIDQQLAFIAPNGDRRHQPLEKLETFLSPALFCLPRRPAVITPIEYRYAQRLLGHSRQSTLCLAKFNRADDRFNYARVEHAMLRLAAECGLHAADSRVVEVGDRDVLLVRRFDRAHTEAGYRRARMLSALTLLRAGDTYQDRDRWSYVILVEELRRLSSDPRADAHELFRRMLFNALISNTDDHPRNHAVIAMDTAFRLAPAYDLTPFTPVSVERRDLAMSIGDAGRYAQADNLLSQCARFLLTREEARALIDTMEAQVQARWYHTARAAGVSGADCDRIASAFAYPGFRLKAQAAL